MLAIATNFIDVIFLQLTTCFFFVKVGVNIHDLHYLKS